MNQNLLSAPATQKYLGGISQMSLWRWLKNPDMHFPQPVRINTRRYWREADLQAWVASRTDQGTTE